MKTYAIPDLHGRFDLLKRAYEIIAGIGDGTIVHLGDYVDRGPDSREVIEFLMDDRTLPVGFHRVILKGNHEYAMTETLQGRLQPDWWLCLANGGAKTMKSYGHPEISAFYPQYVPRAHIEWLEDLPLFHADAHRVYVHAMVDPELSLPEQKQDVMLFGRYAKSNEGHFRGAHVVHGHDSYEKGPQLFAGRTNLDCNAWHSGRLTVGVFDNEKPGGPVDILEVTDD